ncbi:class I adenylate-forming enzyme family protein [Plantactinospora sp. KBS50]|uniref:class I adenylate-forming enzyme family protein n=1 Tax=Plantactinospora sp. KBS50 TaxID=2024580 RepID=UPI000BAAFF3C|nr:class I adenylate-forming enzyme family protein [Plantactinospora sp. KBS50]ASW54777.1 hypothetical protein CIK06_12190 [Plantactinospora sp. KBS50]
MYGPLPAAALHERISEFAENAPERLAFVVAGPDGTCDQQTFAELRDDSIALAALFADSGLGPGEVLVVAIRNHISYLSLVFGAWRARVPVLLLSPGLGGTERDQLAALVAAELGRPVFVDSAPHPRYDTFVVGAGRTPTFVPGPAPANAPVPADPPTPAPADLTPADPPAPSPGDPAAGADETPYLFLTSGGATGLPKVMPYQLRFTGRSETPYSKSGLRSGTHTRTPGSATRLICGNLFHTGNFAPSLHVLLTGSTVITMSRFDPELLCQLLRRHDVYSLGITPLHMMQVLTMPGLDPEPFAGLTRVTHGAAPCPRWVKQGWIDLVGADRLFEIYYSSELGGSSQPVIVSGVDWLRRPGTVGQPAGARVLDAEGRDVPPGTIGEVYFPQTYGRAHGYVGDRALRTAATVPGHVSVADLGWLDEDGYLFIADRMSDVLDIDGHRVLPSVVEEVIGRHPAVADVAVAGTAAEDGATVLYALVQLLPGADLGEDDVLDLCRGSLAAHEVPTLVRFTTAIPRTEEGKMRRSVIGASAPTGPGGEPGA